MPAVALTDQSNLFAMVKFYRAAQAAGVKPIIGVDLRVREPASAREPSTLVLLCQYEVGYRNLTRLVSRAYLEGQQRGVATIDRSWLDADSLVGLIALSGARDGDLGRALVNGRDARCAQALEFWLALFGDRYYLELQRTRPRRRGALHRTARSIWRPNAACRSSRPTTCASSARTISKRTKRACASTTARCSTTRSAARATAPSSI